MAELLELLFYFVFELGGNALIELLLGGCSTGCRQPSAGR